MRINPIKKQDYYERYALIIIFILLICQIFLFYQVANYQKREEHISLVSKASSSLVLEEEASSGQMASFIASVVADAEIMKLADGEIITELESISMAQRIRKYASIIGNINTVYMYLNNSKEIVSLVNATEKLNNDFSNNLINMLTKKKYVSGDIIYVQDSDAEVMFGNRIFYVYNASMKNNNLILVEMRPEKFMSGYNKCQNNIKGNLIVCDNDGMVIYGGTIYKVGSYITENEIFEGKKAGKSEIINFMDRKTIIHYDYSESLERWYISLRAYTNLDLDYRYVLMYMSILIAMFTIFRCYKWFAYLRGNINGAMLKLSQKSSQNEETQKRMAIINYIDDEYDLQEYSDDFFSDKFTNLACCMIHLDNYEKLIDKYSPKDMELIMFGIDNICREIFDKVGLKAYYLRNVKNDVEYIIGTNDYHGFEKKFRSFANMSQEALKSYISANTSFYTSSLKKKEELKNCHSELMEVIEYSFIYGDGAILSSEVIKDSSDIMLKSAEEICERMKESIIKSDGNEKDIYNELMTLMQSMSVNDVRETIFRLLISLYLAMGAQKEKVVQNFDVTKSLIFATGVTSFEKFCSFVEDILNNISEHKNSELDSRVYIMIKKCYDLIEENYCDENLSTVFIADKLGVTVNYLGRKFKETTGKTILNLITEKRLAEAARLLGESDKNVNEIMVMVGYSNSSHFSALFKKWYGLTPLAYRRKSRE